MRFGDLFALATVLLYLPGCGWNSEVSYSSSGLTATTAGLKNSQEADSSASRTSTLSGGDGQASDVSSGAATSSVQTSAASSGTPNSASMKKMAGMKKMSVPPPDQIQFQDHVATNVPEPAGLDGLAFFDTGGERVVLKDFLGKKNIVLVFTEGFAGMLCPFCKTQTSRLVANYDKFAQLDTEILVVYPGARDHLDEFVAAAKTQQASVEDVPFPILLDEEFAATDFFKIRSNLAHPSTFIIDKQGNVRLAYVGTDMTADRPSVKAMLSILAN